MSTPYKVADLRALIQSVLKPMTLWTPAAEELLLATCAQESLFGTYRTQGNGGPARGIFQDEGEDFQDLFVNYLDYHSGLYTQVARLFQNQPPDVNELVNNDAAAVAICRVHYLRAPGALPNNTDLNAIWNYYKAHYNTAGGAATQQQFYDHYKHFVTDGTAS